MLLGIPKFYLCALELNYSLLTKTLPPIQLEPLCSLYHIQRVGQFPRYVSIPFLFELRGIREGNSASVFQAALQVALAGPHSPPPTCSGLICDRALLTHPGILPQNCKQRETRETTAVLLLLGFCVS